MTLPFHCIADLDAALSAEPAQEMTDGIPWWQTAKDCGCWTDSDDTGLVHFGSTEALRVFVTKITAQAYQAGKLVALKPIVNKFGHELRPEIQRALEGSAEHLADRASRLPEMVCGYAKDIGLPPHACGDCSYDPLELEARFKKPLPEMGEGDWPELPTPSFDLKHGGLVWDESAVNEARVAAVEAYKALVRGKT